MLAIRSSIAKYHCLYTQGTIAFQTLAFFTLPVDQMIISVSVSVYHSIVYVVL